MPEAGFDRFRPGIPVYFAGNSLRYRLISRQDAGGAENNSIGVDDVKLIPYKQHPSTAHTDEEHLKAMARRCGSVSENWIASESRKM